MSKLLPKNKGSKKTDRIPDRAQKVLRDGFFAYLGTIEGDCKPHITTMFYIWDEEAREAFLITSTETRKFRNISKNENVSLTVDKRDPKSPAGNEGILIRGRADTCSIEEMGGPRLVQYLGKYSRFVGGSFPAGERIVIGIVPRILHYWKGVNFAKWKNPDY